MEYASFHLAKELEVLEPFGVGNSKPLFAQKDISFVGAKRIGANGNYAKFTVEIASGGYPRQVDLMYFGDVDGFCTFLDEKYGAGSADNLFAGKGTYLVSVTYQIGINSFRGRESLQYIMQNYC
jgi:single-stranded-DNA-specific exonuclease